MFVHIIYDINFRTILTNGSGYNFEFDNGRVNCNFIKKFDYNCAHYTRFTIHFMSVL